MFSGEEREKRLDGELERLLATQYRLLERKRYTARLRDRRGKILEVYVRRDGEITRYERSDRGWPFNWNFDKKWLLAIATILVIIFVVIPVILALANALSGSDLVPDDEDGKSTTGATVTPRPEAKKTVPTPEPTLKTTPVANPVATKVPTFPEPTVNPTPEPTPDPTAEPTVEAEPEPTLLPTAAPEPIPPPCQPEVELAYLTAMDQRLNNMSEPFARLSTMLFLQAGDPSLFRTVQWRDVIDVTTTTVRTEAVEIQSLTSPPSLMHLSGPVLAVLDSLIQQLDNLVAAVKRNDENGAVGPTLRLWEIEEKLKSLGSRLKVEMQAERCR